MLLEKMIKINNFNVVLIELYTISSCYIFLYRNNAQSWIDVKCFACFEIDTSMVLSGLAQ